MILNLLSNKFNFKVGMQSNKKQLVELKHICKIICENYLVGYTCSIRDLIS